MFPAPLLAAAAFGLHGVGATHPENTGNANASPTPQPPAWSWHQAGAYDFDESDLSLPLPRCFSPSAPRQHHSRGRSAQGSNDAVLPPWHSRAVGSRWGAPDALGHHALGHTSVPALASVAAMSSATNLSLAGRTALDLRRHTIHLAAAQTVLRDMDRRRAADLWLETGHARDFGSTNGIRRAAEMLKPVPALVVLSGSTVPEKTERSTDRSAGMLSRLRGGIVSMLPQRRHAGITTAQVSAPIPLPVIVTSASSPQSSKRSHRRNSTSITDDGAGAEVEIHVATRAHRSPSPSLLLAHNRASRQPGQGALQLDWITGHVLPGIVPGLRIGSDVAVDSLPHQDEAEGHPSSAWDSMPEFRPSIDAIAAASSTPRRVAAGGRPGVGGRHKRSSSTGAMLTPPSIIDFSQHSDDSHGHGHAAVDFTTPPDEHTVSPASRAKAEYDAEQSIRRNAALHRTYLDVAEAARAWSSLEHNSSFLRDVHAGQSHVDSHAAPRGATSSSSPWSITTVATPHLAVPAAAAHSPATPVRYLRREPALGSPASAYLVPSPDALVREISFRSDRSLDEAGAEEMEAVLAMDTPSRSEYVSTPSIHSGRGSAASSTHHNHLSTPPRAVLANPPPLPQIPLYSPYRMRSATAQAYYPSPDAIDTSTASLPRSPHPDVTKLLHAANKRYSCSPVVDDSPTSVLTTHAVGFMRRPLELQFRPVEHILGRLGKAATRNAVGKKQKAASAPELARQPRRAMDIQYGEVMEDGKVVPLVIKGAGAAAKANAARRRVQKRKDRGSLDASSPAPEAKMLRTTPDATPVGAAHSHTRARSRSRLPVARARAPPPPPRTATTIARPSLDVVDPNRRSADVSRPSLDAAWENSFSASMSRSKSSVGTLGSGRNAHVWRSSARVRPSVGSTGTGNMSGYPQWSASSISVLDPSLSSVSASASFSGAYASSQGHSRSKTGSSSASVFGLARGSLSGGPAAADKENMSAGGSGHIPVVLPNVRTGRGRQVRTGGGVIRA